MADQHHVRQFLLYVFTLLIPCFVLWTVASGPIAIPAIGVADMILSSWFPDVVNGLFIDGPNALLLTEFGEQNGQPIPLSQAEYRLGFVMNTRILSYSLPFYTAFLECLFGFITSSTSNIPRIKLNVGSAAERLGYSVGPEDRDVTFPEPEVVAEAGEKFLRDLGFGFRAKYLIPAAEAIASGQLKLVDLREASYQDAREVLIDLHGVGEKVADCVLAFSLDKSESFIVDRHILRALHKWYDLPEKASLSYAADWARDYFGEHSSLANQYMFHRERLARRASEWGGTHVERALPEDEL